MRIIVFALVFILSGCSAGSSEEISKDLSVEVEQGWVQIKRAGETIRVGSAEDVSPGDTLTASRDAIAHINLAPGTRVDLDAAQLQIVSPRGLRLTAGSVLAETKSPLKVEAGPITAAFREGLIRVDKDLAVSAGAYEGKNLKVSLGAQSLSVPRFRQAVVAGGLLPKAAKPLQFSAKDKWDRRLLGPAIDLDSRLSNFARGLEPQLPGPGDIQFFQRTAPAGAEVEFLKPFLFNRRSDLLIGFLLAYESVEQDAGEFDARFAKIFGLWSEGATWGLIAQELGIPAQDLFQSLTESVERASLNIIGGGPAPGILKGPRVRARTAPRPTPARPAPGAATRPPAPAPGAGPPVLSPQITNLLPQDLKNIVDDLYGVTDPVLPLPRLT